MTAQEIVDRARRVIQIEGQAVFDLLPRVDERFVAAVEILHACTGRVVVTGIGKSGDIAKKISATLASTGTPAFFLHPAEGGHGDLGMLCRGDVLLAISQSGETDEIIQLLPVVKRFGITLIALTGKPTSTLAQMSDVVIDVSIREEACPLGLAPTASTTATLAMGDALAMALLEERGFREEDFALLHPGGTLGKRLLLRVKDMMHTGPQVPIVLEKTLMQEAILEMTSKKLGITTVQGREGQLTGVITDGDLRRLLQKEGQGLFQRQTGEVMTHHPKVIRKEALAAEAVQIMERHSITSLVVVDGDGRIEGIVHLHDLLKRGVV